MSKEKGIEKDKDSTISFATLSQSEEQWTPIRGGQRSEILINEKTKANILSEMTGINLTKELRT